MNIIKHSQTLSNIYFQERQMKMTPPGPAIPHPSSVPVVSTSTAVASGRMETRRRSSTQPDATPLKKKYKCMKCSHPPFLTKYGLAEHVNIKHQSKGIACDIYGNLMSVHHLEDHKDHHAVSNRYICEEMNKKTGKICLAGYKQKSGILRHIKNVHGKTMKKAKVKIIDRSEIEYESREDYEVGKRARHMTAKNINMLVEQFREEVMVE